MSLRRQVESLAQLSTHVIVANISRYPKQTLWDLPTPLLDDLIGFPIEMYRYPPYQFRKRCIPSEDKVRLLRANTKHLVINDCLWDSHYNYYNGNIIKAALITSKTLTHFISNMVDERCLGDLPNFVRNIPNIVVFKIGVVVPDDVLEAIGDFCPNLESLTCSYILTESGIRRFCLSKSGGQKIKHLTIFDPIADQNGEPITEEYAVNGIRGCIIALFLLQNLTEFNNHWVFRALTDLCLYSNFFDISIPTFQLCKQPRFSEEIHMDKIPNGFLNFINKYCPKITKLEITFSENFANDVIELKKFDEPNFSICGNVLYQSEMSGLVDIGSNLTKLKIDSIEIDLQLIGFACCQLEKLNLYNVSFEPYDPTVSFFRRISFSKLLNFELTPRQFIPPPLLTLLLESSFHLERFAIHSDSEISDEFMMNILHTVNPLKNLINFVVSDCSNITKKLIMEWLNMENSLKNIGFDWISPDFEVIETYIKENNYCVEIIG